MQVIRLPHGNVSYIIQIRNIFARPGRSVYIIMKWKKTICPIYVLVLLIILPPFLIAFPKPFRAAFFVLSIRGGVVVEF